MNRRLLAASLLFALLAVPTHAGPRDELWKQVEQAVQKGLPKTAIAKLEPIIEGAVQDKRHAEAVKAITRKIALEGQIQGAKAEERIVRMQAAIAEAPPEMKVVMEAILANWHWHYFQQNRWRFMRRTRTAAPPGDDIRSWDLPRIFAEIDKQFQKVLAESDRLKEIPVAQWDELLQKGNAPQGYRPTLYDFLAHDALEFYSSGEQAAARPQDAFDLSAGSPIFSSRRQFVDWKPESSDEDSPTLKAVRIYQDLVRFHLDDDDPSALLDVDLLRLAFGNNKALGTEKPARYKAALRRFIRQHGGHQLSARAIHALATAVHGDGDWVEAREIALRGQRTFPDSVGGRRCYNLIEQIEAPQATAATERVWCQPLPTIDVTYRNVKKIHFRAIPLDFDKFARSQRSAPESLSQEQRLALLKVKPVLSWSAELPATDDYQLRLEQLPAPADLKPGSYFLIASHNRQFTAGDNHASFSEFWVSDLALVLRPRQGVGAMEGLVLDARSGEPLKGASVRSWHRDNRNRTRTAGPAAKTDEDGFFRLNISARHGLLLHVRHGEHALSSANNYYISKYDTTPKPNELTIFFTDRSLYRPGQTIRFKGICVAVDKNRDDYQVIDQRDVEVLLQDVNGKEVERLKLRSNEYGSVSGSFTAPRDRLMGRMTIRVDGAPHGAATVTVEEYKRPKFQVELEAPQQAAKLAGPVSLQGKAAAYTGAAIDGAEVRWRVVRRVQYPVWHRWRCWWMPPLPANTQEIAHGATTTAADGRFDVDFVAEPDKSVAEDSEPTFQYTVYADVTDTTGETRSAQRVVRVGYTALAATIQADSWLADDKPVKLHVRTTTLDGVATAAEGTLKVCSLKSPEQVARPPLSSNRNYGRRADNPPPPDPADPNSWPEGDVVFEQRFATGATGSQEISVQLKAGMYRARLETTDRFGNTVTAQTPPLRVLDPDAGQLGLKIPFVLDGPQWTLEPGGELLAVWGSGYGQARAFVEVEHRGRLLQRYWTEPGATQLQIRQPVTEAMRGGFTLRVTMVRENRAYIESRHVHVPWTNKQLTLSWEHFVSKLQPAERETWTAVVRGPDAESAVAEMVAAMYDASLDAYLPHNWPSAFQVFRSDHSNLRSQFENQSMQLRQFVSWSVSRKDGSLSYRRFPGDVIVAGYYWRQSNRARGLEMAKSAPADKNFAFGEARKRRADGKDNAADGGPAGPDLSKVAPRKNLGETAFFFPHLVAGPDGSVRVEFTIPEALTEWKFLGFAHDQQLRGGLLTGAAVTSKELMIQPNPPRFVREGDTVEFTVKVSNQSAGAQTGTVRLTLADAASGRPVDQLLGNSAADQSFDIPAGQSQSFSWKLSVPDDLGYLTYTAVGSTGRLSDGEEGFLPVLSRRVLVTESLPLPIRDAGTKRFEFTRLQKSGGSDSLRHKSLTVQMVSNPSWYGVMALPYLMEFPHACTEQTFNRLYANSLARHIADSDPRIRRVFDIWRQSGGDTLDSPLEKNQDLQAVMLEETPWIRQAAGESHARRNVGILFDADRLDAETARLLRKMSELQYPSGLWPWFPGGPENRYISLYITTGYGRLRHLGVDVEVTPAVKSLAALDAWADEIYRDIAANDRDQNHLTTLIALYLYGRSFFLDDQAVDARHREAVDYWLGQARKYWLQLGVRQSQGHLAVALKRFGDAETARGIVASLKERSLSSEELGMYWRDLEKSWWWYRAPIETQAMMIEVFDEVAGDREAVEDCKVWLLKQKQTQDWKTTKATADAIYALLLRGTDLLASDAVVEVSLGGKTVEPEDVEAGTGFYEQRLAAGEIRPQQGAITVTKHDQGVAWGSVHWQYLEDMSKVASYDGTPLQLTKQLYVKRHTNKGPQLVRVDGPVSVGDELVVRVVLRTDRDMEYVHLKDYRGSGTEPVNVLSRYKRQDGLYYYESTRDAASHFFIDYLPKGVYVFEYSVRVQLRGEYQTGFASIQCMYAPEFNSHSESLQLKAE